MDEPPKTKEEKPLPCTERRASHEHIRCRLEVQAQILVPADSFTPHEHYGTTIEICEEGVEFELRNFPEAFYRDLFSQKAYVRLRFPEYEPIRQGYIIGQIFWIDYHASARGAGRCVFGAFIDANGREFLDRLIDFAREQTDLSDLDI